MRKWSVILGVWILASLLTPGLAVASDPYTGSAYEPESYRGVVLSVNSGDRDDAIPAWVPDGDTFLVAVRVTSGPLADREFDIVHYSTGNPAYDIEVSSGDRVLVGIDRAGEEIVDVFIMDHVRDFPLAVMGALFIVLLVAVGGVKGARAVVVLGLTAAAVFYFLIPMVLAGRSPVAVTVGVSSAVVALGMVIIAGPTRKALAAGAGTVAGVAMAGLLAALFGTYAHLMGLSAQEAQMLLFTPDLSIDFRGLLFAGMILGALGAIMDVGMSIASAVDEVHKANPGAGFWALSRAGMNVGRDILGTMSNTLILAYAGGSLPLLLLLTAHRIDRVKVANLDLIATEVVRALSGSMGLVLCVPITALVAARLASSRNLTKD